jgi:L-ribulokinase
MTTVAGVDFGTLSVRVSLVSSDRGRLAACTAEYPLNRRRDDPDFATQRHSDHLQALAAAMRGAIQQAGIDGHKIEALAIDTTGSSVVPVDKHLNPLDDYYLWCDHRAWREAAEITEAAHRMGVEAIKWCGGVYSSEWGFSKLLHWLRNNSAKQIAHERWPRTHDDENERENAGVGKRSAGLGTGVSSETKLAGFACRNPRLVRRPE